MTDTTSAIDETILQEVRDHYAELFRHLDIAFEEPLEGNGGLPTLDQDEYEDHVEVSYAIGFLYGIAVGVKRNVYELVHLATQGYETLSLGEESANWQPVELADLVRQIKEAPADDDDDIELVFDSVVRLAPGQEHTVRRLFRVRRVPSSPKATE
jgi:hypothetical protein